MHPNKIYNYNHSYSHKIFQVAVSVSVQWRPLRFTMLRHVLGLRYLRCLVNVPTGAWYGTQPGGCVCLEDCDRGEDTRALSSQRMSTCLTPTKVVKHNFFIAFCVTQFVIVLYLVLNISGLVLCLVRILELEHIHIQHWIVQTFELWNMQD